MAKPCYEDLEKAIRITAYLNGENRGLQECSVRGRRRHASCVRRLPLSWVSSDMPSTGDGLLCLRACAAKHWPSTQEAVALSSAEADLYAAMCPTSEATGLKLLRQWPHGWTSCRSGFGKSRRIELAELWMQDLLERRMWVAQGRWGRQPCHRANKASVPSAANPGLEPAKGLWGCRAHIPL